MTNANEWEIVRVLLAGSGGLIGIYLIASAIEDYQNLRRIGAPPLSMTLLKGRMLADGMSLVAQVSLLITGILAMDAPPSPSVPVHFPMLSWLFQPTYALISVALATSSLGRAYLRRRIR